MTDPTDKINAALSSSPSEHALNVASERLAAAAMNNPDWRARCVIRQKRDGYWDVESPDGSHYLGHSQDGESVEWGTYENEQARAIGVFTFNEEAIEALAACDTPYPGYEPTIPPIPAAHNGIEGELLSEYEQSVPTLQSILPECVRKYIRPRSDIGEHDKKIEMDESDGFPGGISVYAVREAQDDLIGDEATGTKSLHTTGEWYMTEEQFIDAVKMMMSLVYVPELDAEPMPPDDSYDED